MPPELVGVAGSEPTTSSSRIRYGPAIDLGVRLNMQVPMLAPVGLSMWLGTYEARSSPDFLPSTAGHLSPSEPAPSAAAFKTESAHARHQQQHTGDNPRRHISDS
jgi:hypothetical protein